MGSDANGNLHYHATALSKTSQRCNVACGKARHNLIGYILGGELVGRALAWHWMLPALSAGKWKPWTARKTQDWQGADDLLSNLFFIGLSCGIVVAGSGDCCFFRKDLLFLLFTCPTDSPSGIWKVIFLNDKNAIRLWDQVFCFFCH